MQTAEGPFQIGCQLYNHEVMDFAQKPSLFWPSRVTASISPMPDGTKNAYRLLVIHLAIGPKAKPMEIILSIMMATFLAAMSFWVKAI